jgi:two-component system response regulator FixJ
MAHAVHVIDDDDAVRDSLSEIFSCESIAVVTYPSAAAFLSHVENLDPDYVLEADCVVTDVEMPQMSGIELARRLKEINALVPVIVMTARTSPALAAEAVSAGAVTFLPKPLDDDTLLAAVRSAFAAYDSPSGG